MTSTAGTGTEIADVVNAPTGDAASGSGGASPVLSLTGISKRFGPVQANADITIEFLAGEIHALLGENGSGKSTLLSIASGILAPDNGTVEIAGERLPSASPRAAMQLGLGMAYQHLTAVTGLTVAENLHLGAPGHVRPAFFLMYQAATEKVHQYELDIAASARIESLSAAEQQMLEVVAALLPQPKVLLLDEPTTALGHADVQRLHAMIRNLAANGMAIVYVSHRLPEVLDVANRITVLRDGVSQGTYAGAVMSESEVVAMMIGRPLETAFPAITESPPGEVLLQVSKLRGRRFGPVDLELRRGEIVGIAGAEGNGQVQLLRALAGVEPSNGAVLCAGKRVHLNS